MKQPEQSNNSSTSIKTTQSRLKAWLKWWFAPRSSHPEESFRERSIRLFLVIFAFITVIVLITGTRTNDRVLFYIIDLFSAVLFIVISIVFVLKQRIDVAGLFVFLLLVRTAFFSSFNGNTNVTTISFVLTFFLVYIALILPAKFIILGGIIIVVANLGGALLAVRLGTINILDLDLALLLRSMFVILIGIGVPLTYLRAQLDYHIAELLMLIDQLERRVEKRTLALQRANHELTKLARAKDDFVSNVSHELRTPITSMRLHKNLLEITVPSLSGNKHLTVLSREIMRLQHIIEDLLSLSRIDQDRIDLEFASVDLNVVARQFITDRIPLAQEKQIGLTYKLQESLPSIQGDVTFIEQALSILLTNALAYTPDGGDVHVYTHQREQNDKMWIGISVSDTGPGIALDDQPRVFERFYRGNTAEQVAQGTGLGLAIAHEIVARHNGMISLDSMGVPGQGATFSLWFPEP